MSTAKLLWFFLWRMTLVGLALGAGLGAAYGLVVVPSVFLLTGVLGSEGFATNTQVAGGAYFLMFFSTPVGGVLGAVAGLTLGFLEGVLLFVVTLFRYRDPSSETPRYQRGAGLTCAVGSLVSFAVLWGAYVFPFVLPNSELSLAELSEVLSRDLNELLLFVVGPAPVAIGAAWLSGRLIARQYVQRVLGRLQSEDGEMSPRVASESTNLLKMLLVTTAAMLAACLLVWVTMMKPQRRPPLQKTAR